MFKYKIILAGAKGVGKSSLIARYCDNIFNKKIGETIGVAFKKKKIHMKGKYNETPVELVIWDFGGEENYRELYPPYANGASAAFILYDTTSKNTIEDIDNWVSIIDENAEPDVIKALIGTKIDLINQRQITSENITQFCEEHDWCAETIETSSKTGENVETAFIKVTKEIMDRKLQICEECNEIFDIRLKFCQYCGGRVFLS